MYISLKAGDSEHSTIQEKFRGKFASNSNPSQSLLNIETDDVDPIFEDIKEAGNPIYLDIRDEPWGQRHFITEDPNGFPIDVIKNIEPSPEFLVQYS